MTHQPEEQSVRLRRFGQLNKVYRRLRRLNPVSDFVLRCRVKDSVESQKVKHGY